MGHNYSNLPKRPPLSNFNPNKDEFQSTNVQRIKQTPFIGSQVYSIDPPIFIDPIDIRLKELLGPRIRTHQLFPPTEVIKFIKDIVNGLGQLEQRGIKAHGDLSFETIYYDKRTKSFKLRHPLFSPQSGYELTRQAKRFSPLSPEQLLYLTDPIQQPPQDCISIKSDMFTLATIVLELCTLIPSNEIYCPQTYVIFDKEIQNRFELLKENYQGEPIYCRQIISILGNLLEYDQEKRRGCKEILWQLEQFEKSSNTGMTNTRNIIQSHPSISIPSQSMPTMPMPPSNMNINMNMNTR